jgi:hypothetical protein
MMNMKTALKEPPQITKVYKPTVTYQCMITTNRKMTRKCCLNRKLSINEEPYLGRILPCNIGK